MQTIFQLKEESITETPLLLFDCQLHSGAVERWSTHQVEISGLRYEARVLRHNLLEIQTSSDMGVDAIPRISIVLANADSHFSEIERTTGWKGAKVTARFLFFNLREGSPATETAILFKGIANPPEQTTESTFTLTAINRMSMQRVLLPEVRLQRRCAWQFPSTPEQREEGVTGGSKQQYSRFFRCGYSPDIPGGVGNLNEGLPYESCGLTRSDCEARGMFRQDNAGNPTRRFGALEFIPSSILVRSYGEKGTHISAIANNEARYNDFVPLIYGTAWYSPFIVFARNDGNLTHMEVLLGMGEIQSVIKVLVNEIELPAGRSGTNMSGTGWFNLASSGNRTGSFNLDFQDPGGNPVGDPYGSMAYLSVVVPNRVNDGRAIPSIKVLIEGLKLPQYGIDGEFLGERFTSNPAWVILDVIRRSGWMLDEIDLGSFAQAAQYCTEEIQTQDLYGNPTVIPRFQCNLVLKSRRSAGDLIRGIRNSSRLFLTYGIGGLLQLRVENSLALQQPSKPDWSNSAQLLSGGWPSYEFGDGTSGVSGILRKDNGEPGIRFWSRPTTDTPNRFTVEFQDAFNEFQQDSFSLTDVEDASRTGQEITAPLSVLGIPNYDQAARILKFNLDKSIQGNTYVELETSVKALGLRPGDLITLTYLKEGFNRQPFRIFKITSGMNYRTVSISAQIHQDSWYIDTNGQVPGDSGGRRQPEYGVGIPRPLIGKVLDENGYAQFEIAEESHEATDGGASIDLTVGFLVPSAPQAGGPGIPLVSLAADIANTGGTLAGGQTLYYSVSAVDAAGLESALSFVVRAAVAPGTDTNRVTLSRLSFSPATTAFHAYRGLNPSALFRIASNRPVSDQFSDTGLAYETVGAPDSNFDHANFYWRLELQPEYAAVLHSRDSIGNTTLQMPPNEYRGMVVRIARGKGAGQERSIRSNGLTTLTLDSAWDIQPDATSFFVVAESGWHFGATGKSSPLQFEVPNRTGAIVHIFGRAANVNNLESASELSTVTRWTIGGAGTGALDSDIPPKPVFGLGLSELSGGTLELSGVGFQNLINTRTVTAATLTLHYWDELAGPPQMLLSSALTPEDLALDLTMPGTAQAGTFLQIDAELMLVEEVSNNGTRYIVSRKVHGTAAASYRAQTPIYQLRKKVAIVPFVRDFFGSPSSGSWSYPVLLPDARVASAELFVTNSKGNSETAIISFTRTVDLGLRTLSGGQFSIQVGGFLAIESDAAPDLIVEASHSVRDIFAVVREAPTGSPIELQLKQNGANYCAVMIPSGSTVSNTVEGSFLPVLEAGKRISLDIVSIGQGNPGTDLTLIIRL